MLHDDRYDDLVRRYQNFYGRVATDQNNTIQQYISRRTVLEVGCGYGQFVQQANKTTNAFSADHDIKSLLIGKQSFGLDPVLSDSNPLCFPDKSFDTIVLRETAHHFDMAKVLPELERISSKEIVIFDSNITLFFTNGT